MNPTAMALSDRMTHDQLSPRTRQFLYAVLLLIRFLFTLQPGYVHPDEFFQGGQELFFGCTSSFDPSNSVSTSGTEHVTFPSGFTPGWPFFRKSSSDPSINDNMVMDGITATWEFQSKNAVRSIIPPTIMTILPLRIYQYSRCKVTLWFNSDHDGKRRCFGKRNNRDLNLLSLETQQNTFWGSFTGWEIWILPRIFIALLSVFFIDAPIWFVARLRKSSIKPPLSSSEGEAPFRESFLEPPLEVILLASSWVTMVFFTRPFSNTLETISLALLCSIAVYDIDKNCSTEGIRSTWMEWVFIPFAMGIIGAVGLFARFTFAIFALPVVLATFYHRFISHHKAKSGVWSGVSNVLKTLVMMGVSFLSISVYFIYSDAIFYDAQASHLDETDHDTGRSWLRYLTPMNAARYNSLVENLSVHGLHPRITHILVNLPMLFGPLALAFIMSSFRRCRDLLCRQFKYQETVCVSGNKSNISTSKSMIDQMLQASLWLGLGVLSCAPHQEPRFLLPLSVPITILYAQDLYQTHHRRRNVICWIIFNMLLMVFFGILHQGGIVPSLLALSNVDSTSPKNITELPSAIMYYKTYMPPTFLLHNALRDLKQKKAGAAIGNGDSSHMRSEDMISCLNTNTDSVDNTSQRQLCNSVPIIDLQSASKEILLNTIRTYLPCSSSGHDDLNAGKSIYLITPRVVLMTMMENINDTVEVGALEGMANQYDLDDMWNFFQFSMEDMPVLSTYQRFLDDSRLSIFRLQCKRLN